MVLAGLVAFASVVTIAVFTDLKATKLAIDTATDGLAAEARLFIRRLEGTYQTVENDARFASEMPPVEGLVRASSHGGIDPVDQSTRDALKARLASVFTRVLQSRAEYMQMRLVTVADDGREVVSVRQFGDRVDVLPDRQLGSVGAERFYREALASALSGVQFSAVERFSGKDGPWPANVAVWRVLAPVKDAAGRLFGFVVIDVNYVRMLERVLRDTPRTREILIFNSDGDVIRRGADEAVTRFRFSDEIDDSLLGQLPKLQGGKTEASLQQDGALIYLVRKNMHAHREGAFIGAAFTEPESVLLSAILTNRASTALVGLLILLASLALAFLLSRRFAEYVVDVAARSRAVIESALDGIVSIDAEGTILSDNPAAERIFQYGPDELIGRKIDTLMPRRIAGAHDGYLSAYRQTGVRKVIGSVREVTGLRRDGAEFPLELSVSELKVNGRTIYTGIVRDISARKAADEALRLAKERADLVIAAMSAGFWEWDLVNGDIIWSPKAREILGFDPNAPPPDFALLAAHRHPDDTRRVEEQMAACLRGEGPLDLEYRFTRFDGKPIWIRATAVVALDDEGKARRLVGSLTDVTDRKEAEKEREGLIEALAQSNRDLDEFAYVASHDLKAPLRVIDNASAWLEEDLGDKLDPESRENLALLRGRARRMDRLLDDLLEYSRIGRKTSQHWHEAVTGAELKEDLLALVPLRPGFSVEFDSGFLNMTANRMPLQQILINLIGNAIKHHDRPTGLIEVKVEEGESDYEFSVIDDGPGIPEQFHQQIFKMFQTLKPRDRVEGSGMGLAIVRKHIDVMGKRLSVERVGERGSIFRFGYPKRKAERQKARG